MNEMDYLFLFKLIHLDVTYITLWFSKIIDLIMIRK